MVVRRGEIWWASLPEPRGSESGYFRPVLVVQSDRFNRSRVSTVLVVTITSNLRLVDAPGNVLLTKKASGLPEKSVANVSQLHALDRSFFEEKVKRLANVEFARVEAGLRLVLSLT